ncbi:uncharacterized protein LOC133035996 [Cannabis sativa]|uniref:uncharacterized protein LOC133035996 n=1 Tax=Cannabis sativa TaxID=3483 RepID=UPI0029CA4933|nr:uncharacterized protein LOC133035996 [Cannabis sativa]
MDQDNAHISPDISQRGYLLRAMTEVQSCIRPSDVDANNFEIKPAILPMVLSTVQFGGLPSEDLNMHLANFMELCEKFKMNGVSDNTIHLRLFPFSLRERVKTSEAFMRKSANEAYELLEEMAMNKSAVA